MQHTPTFFNALNVFTQGNSHIDVQFPHEAQEEVQLTKDAIASCNLVLVEVSIPSTGSGIELGWANAADKPIIAFHQGGSEPSPAIKFVTKEIHIYITEEHILEVLQNLK